MAGLRGVAIVMSLIMLIMFYITIVSSSSSTHGRKLLVNDDVQHNSFSSDRSLYLTALPKGKVPASTPSDKGHGAATNIDQNLIAARRHLAGNVDRILIGSVPSPGVGH